MQIKSKQIPEISSSASDFHQKKPLFPNRENHPNNFRHHFFRINKILDENADGDNVILFHGTSSISMPRIDVEGLEPSTKTLLAEDLNYLIKQFEELNWAGKHPGGYPVLGTFSKRDKNQVKPTISFHLNAQRSALYACGDWAGGETLRAVRHSVLDLLSL